MNEARKYPITSGDREAIGCWSSWGAAFGTGGDELFIHSDSNKNHNGWGYANYDSFNLPAAEGSKYPSIIGGKEYFKSKQFEVYRVFVRII